MPGEAGKCVGNFIDILQEKIFKTADICAILMKKNREVNAMSIDVLHDKIRKMKCPLMVDLSAQPELLPPHLLEQEGSFAQAYARFCREILTTLAGKVPAVRLSFNEFALLEGGIEMLRQILTFASERQFYVLLDGPQMLTPWSAQRSANAFLGEEAFACDGLLISPYIGSDAIRPFVPFCAKEEKDLFVVVRSPNKSASELQDLLTGKRLVQGAAAELVNRFGEPIYTKCGYSRIAAAVSAGYPEGLRTLRSQYSRMFLLVDGLDYPSGNAKNCSHAFDRYGYGAVISVGPGVSAAWREKEGSDGSDYLELAVQSAERLKKNILRYVTIL